MFLRSVSTAAVTAALLFGAAPAVAATVPPAPGASASGPSDLQALVNQYRSANGLQTVSLNGALSSSASWMANDMAAKNYFSHTSSDGRSSAQRMAGAGYPAAASYTGEDLAAGFAGAAQVLAGWIASPTHNAVLLNPNYDAIGIGVGYSAGSSYKWYWVADLGGQGVRVAPVAPPPAVAPPPPVAPPAAAPPTVAAPAAAPPVAAAPRLAPPIVAATPGAPAAAPPASLGALPVDLADPAAAGDDPAGLPSTGAVPAVDIAAIARAAALTRQEDLLVKQMMRLLLRLERRTGF